MGWQGNIFQVLIVVSGPNATGFFVYNGAPAKGSLVAAIVAPGTTSDPFGNTVGAVANFGHWSAAGALLQHFGVDLNGDTFLANTSGLTVQHGHSADGSQWYYDSSGESLGHLQASVAPAAGTDLAGNHYNAGITSYDNTFGGVTQLNGALLQLFAGVNLLQKINPSGYVIYSPNAATGNQVASVAPAAFTDAYSNAIKAGVTSYLPGTSLAQLFSGAMTLLLTGGTPSVTGASVGVQLSGSGQSVTLSSGAVGADTLTQLIVGDSAATQKGVVAIDGLDGNTYRPMRIRQVTTGTQTFTLASAVAITGLSFALGVRTYHVRVYVPFIPSGVIGSSHNLGLSFTGTATANVNGQCFQSTAANGAVNMAFLNGGTLASTVPSPTHVAQPGLIQLEADITVTVAGTLTPVITLGTAGDNIITSAGTFWEINPET